MLIFVMYNNSKLHKKMIPQSKNTTPTVKTGIFTALMSRAVCDDDENPQTIAFSSEYMNYALGFYAKKEFDYNLIVDEFAVKHNGEWFKVTPTYEQYRIMVSKIDEQLKALEQTEYDRLIHEAEETEIMTRTRGYYNPSNY